MSNNEDDQLDPGLYDTDPSLVCGRCSTRWMGSRCEARDSFDVLVAVIIGFVLVNLIWALTIYQIVKAK